LNGVPRYWQVSTEEWKLASLAEALLRLDIASPNEWLSKNRSLLPFVQSSIQTFIDSHGGAAIRELFELNVSATDHLVDGSRTAADKTELYLVVNPGASGLAILGPTLEMLECVHPNLPATFMSSFVGSIGKWIRVYDHDDARQHVEMLQEWMQEGEDASQYEIPNVEESIPQSLKRAPLDRNDLDQVLKATTDSEVRKLMDQVCRLKELSLAAGRPQITEELGEQLQDCNQALPGLVVIFQSGDAVEACFDDEAQHMLECEPEPNVIISFQVNKRESVCAAFRILGTLCETLAAAARLIKSMPGNEAADQARERRA
jgi:hypothetical protein